MKIHKVGSLVLAAMLGLATTSSTLLAQTAGQDMKNAGSETKGAAVDTGHGVAKGTKKAYHGAKHGTKTAAHGTKVAGEDVGHGTKVAAKDVGHGTKVAAVKTKHGAEKVGDKIEGK